MGRAARRRTWSGWSGTDATPNDVDRLWQAFLRRFDIEHTFRLPKQTLGWTCPKIGIPQAADRWTWLMPAAYTQLRLGRPPAADLRRPWERSPPPQRLTLTRTAEGFGTYAHNCPARPTHQNPPGRAQDDQSHRLFLDEMFVGFDHRCRAPFNAIDHCGDDGLILQRSPRADIGRVRSGG